MKELLLLRHAKSSWKNIGMPDHDRPLKKRGLRDAPEVGRKLRELGLAPDRILSSTAARAHTTARLAAEACRFDGTIELLPALYLGGPLAYLDALRDLPADVGRALVVGHNPDLEELVDALAGERVAMPTATLVHLRLPIDTWSELRSGVRAAIAFGPWYPAEERGG